MHHDIVLFTFTLFPAIYAQDLSTTLRDIENLSFLNNLFLNNADLLEELNSAQNITLLAPSDAAWESYIAESGNDLLDDPDFVTALLQYHVLDNPYSTTNFTSAPSPFIPTFLTNRAYVNITGGQVVHVTRDPVTFYSGYNLPSIITQPDIAFSSGFIHIISNPLTIPANITTTALRANLTSLVGATQLSTFPWDNWSNATFFAPTNLAFSRVGSALTDLSPEELHTIMMYHVINDTTPVYTSRIDHAEWISTTGTNVTWTYPIEEGETIFINEAAIVVPDVLVAGGVMHVIDKCVLSLRPSSSSSFVCLFHTQLKRAKTCLR